MWSMNWIKLSHDGKRLRPLENAVMNIRDP